MNKPERDFSLYLITDRHQTLNRPLMDVLEGALAGGVEAVQLREKDLPLRSFLSLAFEIRDLTFRKSLLLINDRIDVCLTVGADGVHLRSDSLSPSTARKILGKKKIIGVSCHSLNDVLVAEKEKADFVTLGPLFFTPSKQSFGPPMGLPLFQSIVEKVKVPVFALGGIKLENIQSSIEAGAHGVAVISAVSNSLDVKKSVEKILERIQLSQKNLMP